MAASTPPTHSDSPETGDSFAHVDDSGPLPPPSQIPYLGNEMYAGYVAEGAAQGAAPPGMQPEALPQPATPPGSLTPWSGDGTFSQPGYTQPQPAATQFSAGQGPPQPWLLARPASGSHSQALAPSLWAIGKILQHRQASLVAGICNRLGE